MNSNSKLVRTLVSTSGRVKSCWHVMRQSASTNHEDYVIESDEIDWFVDSRPWELAYTTTMDGQWLAGNLSYLKEAVTGGADVQIHVVMDDGDVELTSMLADWIHVGQNAVTGEARSLLGVDISDSDFRWPESSKCVLMNVLVGTNSGVKAIRYTYGTGAEAELMDFTIMNGSVLWFLSG